MIEGDAVAFREFVVGASARLFRIAVAVTGDTTAAEDLLQDVLERMYLRWGRIDDPYAYARRALVNRAANRWRARAIRPEVPLTLAHDRDTGETTGHTDNRDELLRAVRQLPAQQRAVVVLRYLEDLTENETAATLGCTVGTVKSHTARAMKRLRLALSPGLAAPPGTAPTRSTR